MQSGSRYCALRSIDRDIERTTRLSLSLDSSWIACKAVPISQAPSGRLQRNILASVAQFETEVRKERQWNGIAAARSNGRKCPWGGKKLGTRITLTEGKEALARKSKAEGQSVASIARNLGIARKTVYVALSRCLSKRFLGLAPIPVSY